MEPAPAVPQRSRARKNPRTCRSRCIASSGSCSWARREELRSASPRIRRHDRPCGCECGHHCGREKREQNRDLPWLRWVVAMVKQQQDSEDQRRDHHEVQEPRARGRVWRISPEPQTCGRVRGRKAHRPPRAQSAGNSDQQKTNKLGSSMAQTLRGFDGRRSIEHASIVPIVER
jgi:hypothetical protein